MNVWKEMKEEHKLLWKKMQLWELLLKKQPTWEEISEIWSWIKELQLVKKLLPWKKCMID